MPVAYASLASDIPGEVISAAVAIGIPKDANRAGLIMEYSARAEESVVVERVKKMVEKGMEVRNRPIKEIMPISATHKVVAIGAVFAGVVLWDSLVSRARCGLRAKTSWAPRIANHSESGMLLRG